MTEPHHARLSNLATDPAKTDEQRRIEQLAVDALHTVYDPEIPVDIYELGLIYDVAIDAAGVVNVRMTLTSPHCPAAQSMPAEVETKLRAIEGVTDVKVEIVWEPPWNPEMMTEAARLDLGML